MFIYKNDTPNSKAVKKELNAIKNRQLETNVGKSKFSTLRKKIERQPINSFICYKLFRSIKNSLKNLN